MQLSTFKPLYALQMYISFISFCPENEVCLTIGCFLAILSLVVNSNQLPRTSLRNEFLFSSTGFKGMKFFVGSGKETMTIYRKTAYFSLLELAWTHYYHDNVDDDSRRQSTVNSMRRFSFKMRRALSFSVSLAIWTLLWILQSRKTIFRFDLILSLSIGWCPRIISSLFFYIIKLTTLSLCIYIPSKGFFLFVKPHYYARDSLAFSLSRCISILIYTMSKLFIVN